MSSSSPSGKPGRDQPSVPRDRDVDGSPKLRSDTTPSPADVNIPDEEYTDQDKPLVADSPEARALHDHPSKTKGNLGVGTAGDAARPTKPGIHNKPIPPRGHM
jgi:hypothetical protein